jgi:hypothetical protein
MVNNDEHIEIEKHSTLTEYSFVKCKVCKQEKVRWLAGYYPNGRDKKWVDTQDRMFNGKQCPDCHALKVNVEQKKKRNNVLEQRKRDRMKSYLAKQDKGE